MTLIAFVILLALYWGTISLIQNQLYENARQMVTHDIYLYGANVSNTLSQKLTLIHGLNGYVAEELTEPEGFSDEDFEFFADTLYNTYSGIRNIAIAPGGKIEFVYPYEENKDVIGYIPAEDERPNVREEVSRAIEKKVVILSQPYELIQGGMGMIARQAVFMEGKYWGLTNLVIDVPAILNEAGILNPSDEISIAFLDQKGEFFFGDESILALDPVQYEVLLPEGSWTLLGAPTNGWASQYSNTLFMIQLLSILLLFSITTVVYLAFNQRVQLQQLVDERTKELRHTEEMLRKDIAAREKIKKENEKLLKEESQQRNLAETLSEVTLLFTSHTSTNRLLEEILTQIHRLVPYETANIALLEGNKLTTRTALGYKKQETHNYLVGLEQNLDDLYYDTQAVRNKKTVVVSNVQDAEEWLLIDETSWIQSFMSIPICYQDEVFGLIRIDGKTANMFSEADAEKLQPLANAAAISLHNARLYEQAEREITERKKAENQVRRLNDELELRVEERTAELIRINQELEAFAYSISHDLRAPVRAIKGITQLLDEEYAGSFNEEAQDYLERITTSSEKMNDLIEGLLALSRMGQQQLNMQTLNLTELAAEIFAETSAQEVERDIELKIPDHLEIIGDKLLVETLLTNLMSNAVKFSRGAEKAII